MSITIEGQYIKNGYTFFIGKTGSGKTTLLESIMGFYKRDVYINGILMNSKNKKCLRSEISYVFQQCQSHFIENSVEKEIKSCGSISSAIDILKKLSLDYEQIKKKSPFELSGGEQRKLAIALALLKKPKILLLDEPTIGLDNKSASNLMKYLNDLVKSGIHIIQVTHIMDEVYNYSTQTFLIDNKNIVKEVDIIQDNLEEYSIDLPFEVKIIKQLSKYKINLTKDKVKEYLWNAL